MAESAEPTVQQLFKRWRSGDADAGRAMAQKFTDWFYAITAVRLGDQGGRDPLQRACATFAEGIVNVPRSSELVEWAHDIIKAEVDTAGGRIEGGDFPNALTANRSPTELLKQARLGLSREHARMLDAAYGGQVSQADLIALAEQSTGFPHAVLEARYALKRWLRGNARINFAVVPEQPDLDRAPLPLYEANQMSSDAEVDAFEQWLISDIDLCRDVAEFATFAHGLRAGAFAGPHPEPAPAPAPAPTAAPAAAPAATTAPAPMPATDADAMGDLDGFDEGKSSPPATALAVALVGVLVTLVLIIIVLYVSSQP